MGQPHRHWLSLLSLWLAEPALIAAGRQTLEHSRDHSPHECMTNLWIAKRRTRLIAPPEALGCTRQSHDASACPPMMNQAPTRLKHTCFPHPATAGVPRESLAEQQFQMWPVAGQHSAPSGASVSDSRGVYSSAGVAPRCPALNCRARADPCPLRRPQKARCRYLKRANVDPPWRVIRCSHHNCR